MFKVTFAYCGLIVVLVMCAGCQTDVTNDVMIRVTNESEFTMHDVVVGFPAETEEYGDIAPGNSSDYRKVEKAYRYARVETTIEGKKADLQPIDYVGEELLAAGRYTYVLDVNTNENGAWDRLALRLEAE